ncbi:hypothetical protein FXO38_31400 [Capsicum annuum]|nr:hypothetical protein FXO38_31400 [Capsicum annuum]KAF3630407.1 hypothetical protein FXO37_28487 [Capsicum annuum]
MNEKLSKVEGKMTNLDGRMCDKDNSNIEPLLLTNQDTTILPGITSPRVPDHETSPSKKKTKRVPHEHMLEGTKFEIEKFDGRINFGVWQVQVKDVLIQSGLHKALKERPTSEKGNKDSEKSESSKDSEKSKISDEEWEELDMKAASQIRLYLAKNVLANVIGLSTTKELWEKLEELYQTKSISNRLYLKEQFHKLQMAEGTTISDHLSVLNGIVSELESIGVKINDEDKALRLIWFLPSSYKHMQPILIYGKKTVIFVEVTSKLISEEKRLKNGDEKSLEDSALVVKGKWKQSSKKKVICWNCKQPRHVKNNCPNNGASSARSSKENAANVVSLQ